jgi:hypothetical protein
MNKIKIILLSIMMGGLTTVGIMSTPQEDAAKAVGELLPKVEEKVQSLTATIDGHIKTIGEAEKETDWNALKVKRLIAKLGVIKAFLSIP